MAALCLATLSVQATGNLVITPGAGVTSTGFARGPFSVTDFTYTLNNSGGTSLDWSVGNDRPWISISEVSGTLAGGATKVLDMRINSLALALPVGTHTATLTFINLTVFGTETRTVTLTIGLPGAGTAVAEVAPVMNRYRITMTGASGSTVVVEDAPAVTGPWDPVKTNTLSGSTTTHDFTVGTDPGRYFRAVSSGPGAVASTLSLARVEAIDNTLVRVTGDPYGVYVIESTTNSVNWVPVHTNKVPASGNFLFTNAMAAVQMNVSYQAVAAGALVLPDLNHILLAGESMAVGFDGAPALSTTAQGSNYRYRRSDGSDALARLVELGVETIASGAARHVVAQAPLHNVLVSNIGQPGAIYELQRKGTPLYAFGLDQFRHAGQAVACHLYNYLPRAIFVVGGEGDYLNTGYGANVRQLQADYQKDIKYLTGHTGTVPMFHSQGSSWTAAFFGGGTATATGPIELLAEAEANPALTVLVGPRYFLPYGQDGVQFPGIHLTNEGYRRLGAYYGKVYKRVVVDGGNWSPLRPVTVTRNGAVITATFNVPVTPLVLDTTQVTNPGNFGFEYHDDSGAPPAISNVAVTGPSTVTVTLASVPTGSNQRLRYAYTGVAGNSAGPTTGPRGNLRDSDATTSPSGAQLPNWCVHFDKSVN